ncbi:MAG: acetyl-CoA carboxylase biotin carboxylase subunit [Thermodesulfovibrionales bacterium]|nr:acetyl-CoA carboxylase biotin carboxylase subunit [Thermodesulfovibrionales bacterium]
MFKKVLIANRGEIAVRVIRACRELDIRTVSVYSDIDRNAMHVRLADEAICIGPADPALSYLSIPALLTAAELTDSEAIHPGYGFLSENAHFAETCEAAGISFIGPSAENIKLGGDKIKAKEVMRKRGIPVVPGSNGPVLSEDEATSVAEGIGFPVILKASQGGGGKGMKIVNKPDELMSAYHLAQREALTAFGNKELYLEKYISPLRHIEVQIVADKFGNVIHLGERDCSVQRRHQKLIEESPCAVANPKVRKRFGDLAIKAAKAFRYSNVGTVEFAVDPDWNPFFMEINTRVQVEHPVTEAVTDFDLIKEQIRLAAGEQLGFRQSQVHFNGHAIECRINAEDPDTFIPSPGKIEMMYPSGGPGVRVDTAAYAGWSVPMQYDSLIAKLIVHGRDRQEAISRMRRALYEFKVEGIKTTVDFHKRVLEDNDFLSGHYNTGLLEKMNLDRS